MSTHRWELPASIRSLEQLRRTYHPGATPHHIQVLNYATHVGTWEAGVLLAVDGLVAVVQLDNVGSPTRVGTLWPDRLAREALGDVARDPAGRPRIRWNRRARVLQLDGWRGSPTFNVVDLDANPHFLEIWMSLPANELDGSEP